MMIMSKTQTRAEVATQCKKINEISTFKIDLEKNEERARNELVLPHTRVFANTAIDNSKPVGGGAGSITYYPDTNDDFDSDDPDEDLDI